MGSDYVNWCDRCGNEVIGTLGHVEFTKGPGLTRSVYGICDQCIFDMRDQMKHCNTRAAKIVKARKEPS